MTARRGATKVMPLPEGAEVVASRGLSNRMAKALMRAGIFLANKLGRPASPQDYVDYARPPSSPIHELFEWDDTLAAEAHRRHMAGHYVRCVVIDFNDGSRPVRAMMRVVTDTGAGQAPLDDVLSSANYREQVLASARAELQHFTARYERVAELMKSKDLARIVRVVRMALRAEGDK